MPIVDAEQYQSTPGYQQIYEQETRHPLFRSYIQIKPTSDRSLHTYMLKLGKDGYVNKKSPVLVLVVVYFILFIFTVMLSQGRKPIFVIMMAIVVAAALTLLITTIYRSRPNNLLIDHRGVTIRGILRPWEEIKGTFIVTRGEAKYMEWELALALHNGQNAYVPLEGPTIGNTVTASVATAIKHYRP